MTDPLGPPVLRTAEFEARVVDNRAVGEHYAGYNGLMSLVHQDQGKNIFVPDFSGLNYELTTVDGVDNANRMVAMEPRYAHMDPLVQLPNGDVCLYQPPTPKKQVESRIVFRAAEPHAIDFHVTYILHRKVREPAAFVALWASYMNDPGDISLYFLGRTKKNDRTRWLQIQRDGHGANAPVLAGDPDGNEFESEFRWEHPFYYGLMGDFVYLIMFDDRDRIDIQYSANGGINYPIKTPAWDFEFKLPDYEVNKEYKFQGRLVYTRFSDREAVFQEYESWNRNKPVLN